MKKVFFIVFLLIAAIAQAQKYKISGGLNTDVVNKLKQNIQPYDMMEYGYLVNAYNTAYLKTSNIEFLRKSYIIISAVERFGKNNNNQFKAQFDESNKKFRENGLTYPVYEGYYFQYAAQFFYIISSKGLTSQFSDVSVDFVEKNFLKWLNANNDNNNRYSLLLKSRRHMGAQWATTALYLNALKKDKRYEEFLKYFDNDLRNGLITTAQGGYIWYSNYTATDRNAIARNANKKNALIAQDVSHANHVVNYILTAYKLGYGKWSRQDINKLIITLKTSVNDFKTLSFNDNIDGTKSTDKAMQGRGWKQTDGWMKLAEFDPALVNDYKNFYKKNYNYFKNSVLNAQFEANIFIKN